jgi:fatty acid amide hydrolase 2
MNQLDPSEVNIGNLNVLDIEDNGAVKVSTSLRAAQRKASDFLESKGAKIKRLKIEALKNSFDIWSAMMTAAGGTSFSTMMAGGKRFHPVVELIKMAFGLSSHTLPATVLAMIEPLPKLMPKRTERFVQMGVALRKELVELIGPKGVMLYPSYSSPAPVHNRPLLTPFNFAYTAILNVMEFPVTQVPLGLNEKGLPVGVQVAGIHGNDHVTIAVALELEKAFGGWVPPRMDT